MSAQKQDSICLVGIFKAPPHLSKVQFENKLEAVADAFLSLPGATQGLLKYEMFIQNIILNDHIQALGFPAPHPAVLMRTEWESLDQVVEIMRDARVMKLAAGAIEELGIDVDSCTFSADVVTKIDQARPEFISTKNHVPAQLRSTEARLSVLDGERDLKLIPKKYASNLRLSPNPRLYADNAEPESVSPLLSALKQTAVIGIFKVPSHLSKEQFEKKFEALVDASLALPAVKNGLLKYEMNTGLHDHIQAFGLLAMQPTVVLKGEWETMEHLKIPHDPAAQKLWAEAIERLGFARDSCTFSADIGTKFKQAKQLNRGLYLAQPGFSLFVSNNPTPSLREAPLLAPHRIEAEFKVQLEDFLNDLRGLPVIWKNTLKLGMITQNSVLEEQI
ncbi:hypothetical protein FB451DRAFT_1558720 [Mycena latifolia]|nr:hypothetical protein FB451DRAFT_1558720 [Mycena latifolia]